MLRAECRSVGLRGSARPIVRRPNGRDYFLPGLQALFKFVGTATFRERASELTGYDVSDAGNVRWVN